MQYLAKEKFKVLAERNGWSLACAEGYVDGETYRRRGKLPPQFALIGIDEYSRGFRAGYFERQDPQPVRQERMVQPELPMPALRTA